MPVKIKWSESAVEDYTSVINYLKKKWPATLAERFINIVESRVDQLHYFPFIGTASQKSPDIRSIIITKHNKLYYGLRKVKSRSKHF